MDEQSLPPIVDHPVGEESAFTAAQLMRDVRAMRGIPAETIPAVCVLEFDGDLTDSLVAEGLATRLSSWACFHTTMYTIELEGVRCGIIARTIGGPYATLVAEQLHEAGARVIVGLTSAGRLAPELPLPCLVVATSAVRDEGTSYHYLAPAEEVACPVTMVTHLQRELAATTGWSVRAGKVWTTDAPYRETHTQVRKWAGEQALAVEMQAASLFAFGVARQASVAAVLTVSNAIDHQGEQFNTGSPEDGLGILRGIVRAAQAYLESA